MGFLVGYVSESVAEVIVRGKGSGLCDLFSTLFLGRKFGPSSVAGAARSEVRLGVLPTTLYIRLFAVFSSLPL